MEVESSSAHRPAESFMHKNRLQQYAQRSALPLPVYQTVGKGSPHAPQFQSIVTVDGMTFSSSQSFSTRKESEQNVAKVALEGISTKIQQEGCPLIRADTTFCKSILHEYAVKMNLERPTYVCSQLGGLIPTFISSVSFAGKTYKGVSGRNKKEAQQLGARAVIEAVLGDCNSSTRTLMSQIIKSKRKLYAAINHVSDDNISPVMHLLAEGNPDGKEVWSVLANERPPIVAGNVVADPLRQISETCIHEINSGSTGNETSLLHQSLDGQQAGIVSFSSDANNHLNGSNVSIVMCPAFEGKPENFSGNSLARGEEMQSTVANESLLVAGHVVAPTSRQISEACPTIVEVEPKKEYMHEVNCLSFGSGTSLAHQPQDGPQTAVVSLSSDALPGECVPSGAQKMSSNRKKKSLKKQYMHEVNCHSFGSGTSFADQPQDGQQIAVVSLSSDAVPGECVPTNCSKFQIGPSGLSSGAQEMSSNRKKKRPKKGKRECRESKPKKSRSNRVACH